jgi:hypothetical protein
MKIGFPALALVGVVVGVLGFIYATSGLLILGWMMVVAGFVTAALAVMWRVCENRRLLRRWVDEDDRQQN